MRIYLNVRDWWVGYYRGTSHHYICPLPCVVIEIGRRSPTSRRHVVGPGRRTSAAVASITLEELIADAHLAITETDWADEGDAFSTESYLACLQTSLPTSHQLGISELRGLSRPALAVAGPDGSAWTVCVPGIGSAPCRDLTGAVSVAEDLIQHHPDGILACQRRPEASTDQESRS